MRKLRIIAAWFGAGMLAILGSQAVHNGFRDLRVGPIVYVPAIPLVLLCAYWLPYWLASGWREGSRGETVGPSAKKTAGIAVVVIALLSGAAHISGRIDDVGAEIDEAKSTAESDLESAKSDLESAIDEAKTTADDAQTKADDLEGRVDDLERFAR